MPEPVADRGPQGARRRHPVPPVPVPAAVGPSGLGARARRPACPCTRTRCARTCAGSRRPGSSRARSRGARPSVGRPQTALRRRSSARSARAATTGCSPRSWPAWSTGARQRDRAAGRSRASGAPTSSGARRPKPGARQPERPEPRGAAGGDGRGGVRPAVPAAGPRTGRDHAARLPVPRPARRAPRPRLRGPPRAARGHARRARGRRCAWTRSSRSPSAPSAARSSAAPRVTAPRYVRIAAGIRSNQRTRTEVAGRPVRCRERGRRRRPARPPRSDRRSKAWSRRPTSSDGTPIVPEFNGWLERARRRRRLRPARQGRLAADDPAARGAASARPRAAHDEHRGRGDRRRASSRRTASQRFHEAGEVDFAYSIPHVGRFRVNVFRQRGSISMVLRKLRFGGPIFEEIGPARRDPQDRRGAPRPGPRDRADRARARPRRSPR